MIDALDIGYAVKDRRAELGLTQAQLASAAGVSKRFLSSLEMGQNSGVQLDKLTAVFEVLGLDLVIVAGDVTVRGNAKRNVVNMEASSPDGLTSSTTYYSEALAILTGSRR